MDTVLTRDPELALEWCRELLGEGNPAPFFLAPRKFDSAARTADSVSITLTGEQLLGLSFGPHPPLNPLWDRCAISDTRFKGRLGLLTANDKWDFYSADTTLADSGPAVEILSDADEITSLLRAHAPQSQVWPGDREIVHWYGARTDAGQLASIGAQVRWESGQHVLSSIATVSELRGRGFAQVLTRGIVRATQRDGIDWLGLGVHHDNAAAQRAYQNAGFQLRASFTNYEKQ
jgi:GNAT superfamily N-acetyltransferase